METAPKQENSYQQEQPSTLILQDKVQNAINHITTERLARKMMGITEAFKSVEKEADWEKPNVKFKSKVDYEMWKRIDPSREDTDYSFINRKAENELREEMERDANMLKAKSKLKEMQKAS